MTYHNLDQKGQLLSLWVKDRLADREAVQWAVSAIKRVRGDLGTGTIALFRFLDDHAHQTPELSHDVKKVWRLLRIAAEDSAYGDPNVIFNFRNKVEMETLRVDDVRNFVEQLRPRLRVAPSYSGAGSDSATDDNPIDWVHWTFNNNTEPNSYTGIKLDYALFAKLDSHLLVHLIESGTSALIDALILAGEIGWIDEHRDIPNSSVRQVFLPEVNTKLSEDEDERDPDSLNKDFAPVVRLLSLSFCALSHKEATKARHAVLRWQEQKGGLFVRLFAFASWKRSVIAGNEVGDFLEILNNHAFWRWSIFPEVATLRAKRWNDLPPKQQEILIRRLLSGPDQTAFQTDEPVATDTLAFHRDHEIARISDSNAKVPEEFTTLIQARRGSDSEFPSCIALFETGLSPPRASWVPSGDPKRFKDVSIEQLPLALVEAHRTNRFGHGDDAEAFARTGEGKKGILDALVGGINDADIAQNLWELLLSYPHEGNQETQQEMAERTAALSLRLEDHFFSSIAGRLCYWLDAVDEKAKGFCGADKLWERLLPIASDLANAKASTIDSNSNKESDLSMAALNEPLGHLLSFFLRRCPDMPAEGKRPSLPLEFVRPLKALNSRAKGLLANRMAIHMNYFVRADAEWLEDVVVGPMKDTRTESVPIWEAFAKYGAMPAINLWQDIQRHIFQQISSSQLSPDSKRRLAEMVVIAWVWSKNAENRFSVDAPSLRNALALTSDDVRGSAALTFATLFPSDTAKTLDESKNSAVDPWPRLGHAFFAEAWPLEPTLQSAATANHFARVPARTSLEHFSDATDTILPYLRPFEVWSVASGFSLDGGRPESREIITNHSDRVLILLAACIAEDQHHSVHGLKTVLDLIIESNPNSRSDPRVRRLRRLEMR